VLAAFDSDAGDSSGVGSGCPLAGSSVIAAGGVQAGAS
jgi:hypothetical protein